MGYVRVSTDEQGDHGASLEAQRRKIAEYCSARDWTLLTIHEDVASGKEIAGRPGIDAALAAVRSGEADVLAVAKLDRFSRSARDAANTLAEAQAGHWNFVAIDLGLDFSTIHGELVAHVMAAVAQAERRMIGERTKAALAVKRSQGVRLGRPPVLDPALGRRILRLRRREKMTTVAIAALLEAEGVPAPRGGSVWYPMTVWKIIRRVASEHARAAA